MTGLAQISGRNELDYEERFKCDVWYVDNQSIVDFKIMFKTVSVMTNREELMHLVMLVLLYLKEMNQKLKMMK
jgi:lipopolysaccharide/colanic/teichoic acid biosynthesis glycosyltransferase